MDFDNLLKNNTVIIIAGPTASGKTDLSLHLAQEFDSEIISADSRQLYKYLDIGTAKPGKDELKSVKHHFIDIVNPDEYYSAGLFGNEAYKCAKDILYRKKIPIVVGGSGLYIKAMCDGLFEENSDNVELSEIRKRLENELIEHGLDYLYSKLMQIDAESALLYKEKNPRRIIRALEYYYSSGNIFSEAQKIKTQIRAISPIYFVINRNREELYDRINLRSEIMWKSGIIEETQKVLKMGYSKDLNSLNTVGYKEVIAFIENRMSEQTALDKMKQTTRNYAKRQVTWFKRLNAINLCQTEEQNFTTVLSSL